MSGYYIAIIEEEEQFPRINLKFEPILNKFREEMNEIFTDFAKSFK
jgi:hypothetical protein